MGLVLVGMVLTGLAGCGARGRPESLSCPTGMQLVPRGVFRYGDKDVPRFPLERDEHRHGRVTKETLGAFCIDRYEFPNREGARPTTGIAWLEAASECGKLGKRLCTEYEWEKACRGPRGLLYPWGNQSDPTYCGPEASSAEAHRSGARAACVSAYGVHDMTGSAWEWTANAWGGSDTLRVVRGGWEEGPGAMGARCTFRAARDAASVGPRVGFRCCADPVRDNPPGPRLTP